MAWVRSHEEEQRGHKDPGLLIWLWTNLSVACCKQIFIYLNDHQQHLCVILLNVLSSCLHTTGLLLPLWPLQYGHVYLVQARSVCSLIKILWMTMAENTQTFLCSFKTLFLHIMRNKCGTGRTGTQADKSQLMVWLDFHVVPAWLCSSKMLWSAWRLRFKIVERLNKYRLHYASRKILWCLDRHKNGMDAC